MSGWLKRRVDDLERLAGGGPRKILVIRMDGINGNDPSEDDPPELKELNAKRVKEGLNPYRFMYVANNVIFAANPFTDDEDGYDAEDVDSNEQ